ncbi:MAG: hypothetical protein JXB35_04100 [Anaerolineae bacterium]|nr:hypothetical protein [Anaerolineae bacterium]
MKRWCWFCLELGLMLALSTGIALAQDGSAVTDTDSLWTMLAPITAIATATERILEFFWDRFEKKDIRPNKTGVSDPKSDPHVFRKKQWSHWLGMASAFIMIGLTNARFFRLLGIDVLFANLLLFNLNVGGIFDDFTIGTVIDWLMTAGIIGWGGTELVHNLIEGLVKGRSLWKETQQVREGERVLTETKLFHHYLLPQVERLGISREAFLQMISWLREAGIPLDDFAGAVIGQTTDQLFEAMEASPEGVRAAEALRNLLEREELPDSALIEVPNLMKALTPDLASRLNQS